VLALVVILPFLGVTFSAALLWVPLLVVMLILITTALTLLASCANVFYRDVIYVVQLILSFGIFFTPVFFDAEALGPRGSQLLMLNTLGPVLEGLRLVVVRGHDLASPLVGMGGATAWSPWFLLWSGSWAVVGTAVAAIVFRRAEFAFAEYV
jgi:ABC-type polysaccharide/polyol phosphate export permease